MEKRLIEEDEMRNFMYGVMRGIRGCFEECAAIEEAVSFKSNIPRSFWKDEEKGGLGIMGYEHLKKNEIRKIRKEIIEATLENLHQDGFEVDHYERLFRVIRIFNVPDAQIPEVRDNLKYNTAYYLYKLIKSDDDAKSVSLIGWMVAEISK